MLRQNIAAYVCGVLGTIIVFVQFLASRDGRMSLLWLIIGLLLACGGWIAAAYLRNRTTNFKDKENELVMMEKLKNAKK